MQQLRTIEAAIAAPDLSGVLVCGPAGVGKSRMVRDAMALAAAQGCECRWAIGTSSAQAIPLGAFAEWARTDASDTVQMLRGVIGSLTAAAPGATVIVGVDDADLIDDLSAFVLQQIVQRAGAKVMLTVRDGAPMPVRIQEILKAGRFDRLDVEPLSQGDTGALLTAALAGPVDPDAVHRLWSLTRGNALYVQNIVEQEVGDGRLALRDGRWRWSGDPVIAPGLVELIESRIGELPVGVDDVIDTLAIAEPIELGALTRITGPAAVEEAEARGLIGMGVVAGGAVEVRVAHPLYAEVRRSRASVMRLRRLRGRVAAELASSGSDDTRTVVRRATLSLDSDLPPDPDLLVRAAQGAVWLADLALADRLAEGAIRAGAGPEADFIRAHALSWLSHGEDAEKVLADLSTRELTDEARAMLAFLRSSNVLWVLADAARAKDLIDGAAVNTPSEFHSYVDAFLAVYWFALDDPQAATRVLDTLEPDGLPAVVDAEIAWVRTDIAAEAGHTGRAVAMAEAAHSTTTRLFEAPQMRLNIADAHVSALLLAGRVGDAVTAADRAHREAADLPGAAQMLGAAVAGRAALGAGRLDSACDLLTPAVAVLSASGHLIGWGYRYQVPLITALAMRGRTDEAERLLTELSTRPRRFRMLDFEISVARAWLAAGQGAVREAGVILVAAAETAASRGQFANEVMCLQLATQFGASVAPRLRELEGLVEGPRVGLAARYAEALRDGDAGELAAVSDGFETMGDVVAAVDAAAQAATLYRRRDMRGSGLSCSTRADALAARCGVSTPALLAATEQVPLTDREREIVMLIGQGASNRAIAERLTVSPRTVESHIYRAMAKTGTTSRDELAALLPRHGSRG